MKAIKEILKEKTTQENISNWKLDAAEVYSDLLDEISEVLNKRGSNLILNERNKRVIGQIALWYSCDPRFKGSLEKGLMIRGNVGTGKSVIVEALCNLILERENIKPYFIHVSELQDLYIRNDFEEIDKVKNRRYAIIDDVGVEAVEAKSYGNVKEPFNDVFDYRYRNDKLTIITTNLTPSEIEETYGTRIIDRFRECMNDLILDGESFRK